MHRILKKIIFLLLVSQTLMAQPYPTRSDAFYCSCSGNSNTQYPEDNYTLKHYIITPDGKRVDIAKFCDYMEFAANLSVPADGGKSFIDITFTCQYDPFSFFDDPEYELNSFAEDDYETYGKLSVEFRVRNRVLLKYEHPKNLPPSGVLYDSVFPILRFVNTIKIYRPPVAMIHGLWADMSSFDTLETYLINSGNYASFQTHKIDYSGTNDRAFWANDGVVEQGVRQVIEVCRSKFLAVSKADVVCHSMGGLLTRRYVQGPLYKYYSNVNKIITCNTPHQGSQMANWLLDPSSAGGLSAGASLTLLGMSTLNGAVSDLRVNSPALSNIKNGIPTAPVRVHALTSVNSHQVSVSPLFYMGSPIIYTLFQVANYCGGDYISDIFNSRESDLVVALESQKGGLSNINTRRINNQVHVGSVANVEVIEAVNNLLGLPNDDPEFTDQFSPVTLHYSLESSCFFPGSSIPTKQAGLSDAALTITAPVANQNVIAGTDLTINFSGTNIDSVIAFLPQTQQKFAIQKVKSTNNIFALPTDIQLLGPVKLVLEGYNTDREMVITSTVNYNQITNATLDSLFPYPVSLHLNQTDTLPLSIFGKYSDGIVRNITYDSSLMYSFKHGTAGRFGKKILLNTAANDTLKVSKGGLTTNDIGIYNLSKVYPQNCNIVSTIANEGAGSLRMAVECVDLEQTISFDASIQNNPIVINETELDLYKSVSIVNSLPEKVTIKSLSGNLFNIFGSAEVILENVHLIVPDDNFVAIQNYGKLTLKNVLITSQNSGGPRLINHGEITIQGLVEIKD